MKKEIIDLKKMFNTFHGMSNTRIYHTWIDMKTRILNPNSKYYKYYGGRGLKMCSEWLFFDSFYEWAMNNGYNDNMTIDRKDNDKGYFPGNCRFVPKHINDCNRRKKDDYGIRPHKDKFYVRVNRNGRYHHLGTFTTIREAKKARDKFVKEWEKEFLENYSV